MNRADGITDAARFSMPGEDMVISHLYQSRTALLGGRPEESVGTELRIRVKIVEGEGIWEKFRIVGFTGRGDTLAWVVAKE